MPLPWKKNKVSRISRLVADLQTPNRGGSLIVETGFPTSLVDLFVKNRDRLRDKKNKKKSATARQQSSPATAPARRKSESSSSSSDLITMNLSSGNSLNGVEKSIDFDCIEDNVLRQDKEQDEKIGVEDKGKLNNGFEKSFDFDDGSRAKSVLIVGLKVFVAVALALSTKKLAVGITMSAFALLFLEYAGKHLACLHGRCSKTLMWFDSMIQSVVSLFMKRNSLFCKKGIVREKLVVLDESDSNGLICGVELTSSIEEIECIESESSPSVDKQVEEITTELDKRLEHRRSFVESKHGDEVGNRSWRWHGKSINIGSKFVKKLVPKKLRSSKEYCKDKERYPCSGQFVCAKSLDIENHEKLYQELSRCPSDVLNNELLESSEDGSSCGEAVEASRNSTGGESPSPITTRDSKRYSNSGMGILVLVVLAGLGWGRLLSLVVTVAGYSIAAFVEKLRRDQTSNCT